MESNWWWLAKKLAKKQGILPTNLEPCPYSTFILVGSKDFVIDQINIGLDIIFCIGNGPT